MCMSPSGQRDDSVVPSEASLEDLQVCVCVGARSMRPRGSFRSVSPGIDHILFATAIH